VAQAVRREIRRQEKKNGTPIFKRVLNANRCRSQFRRHLDGRPATICTASIKKARGAATTSCTTPEGARLEPNVIVVQKDRLMIGNDPLGIYVFERPDKKTAQ